jgi:nucleoside-diphosphate-sugar epimerase
MFVLITGSQGGIGTWTVKRMLEAGHTIRTIDRAAQRRDQEWEHLPGDIRDIHLIRRAVQGVDAVIHLAAIPYDVPGYDEMLLTTNLQGTWNILLACGEVGVPRLVNFSSINALGHAEEKPNPGLYLPLDDDIPHYLARGYNTSKHMGEELCLAFANRHDLTAISLRPTMVLQPDTGEKHWWDFIPDERKAIFATKDFWSYIDVRDVAEAALLALTAPIQGHQAFLLAADDNTAKITTAELLEKYYAGLPWPRLSKDEYLAGDPFRSLVDCSKAKALLGWQPKYRRNHPNPEVHSS